MSNQSSRNQRNQSGHVELPQTQDTASTKVLGRIKQYIANTWLYRAVRSFGLREEINSFMENLSMMLEAGMDVLTALDAIQRDMRTARMKRIVNEMSDSVRAGGSLWESVSRASILPSYVVSLLRIGEEAGRLTQNMSVIVIQQQKDQVFRSKVRAALMYPAIVLVISVILGIGMAWFILPRLVSVFSQLDIELPLVTRILVRIGEFLRSYGNIVVPLSVVVMVLVVYFVFFYSRTKFIGQRILFGIPGIRKLIRQVELARLGYVWGTLLEAGLPINKAISSLEQATSTTFYRTFYAYMGNQVSMGASLKEVFASYPKSTRLVPAHVQQMIISGERSGSLPHILKKIGTAYEAKTDSTSKNLTIILEPILLVVVWIGVAGIALAIIMPIYGLVGGFNARRNAQSASPGQQETTVQTPSPTPTATPTATPTPTPEPVPQLTVTDTPTGTLNVRGGPSTNEPILTQIFPDEVYEYDETDTSNTNATWYRIILETFDDEEPEYGWVHGDYVTIRNGELEAEPTTTPTPQPTPDSDSSI